MPSPHRSVAAEWDSPQPSSRGCSCERWATVHPDEPWRSQLVRANSQPSPWSDSDGAEGAVDEVRQGAAALDPVVEGDADRGHGEGGEQPWPRVVAGEV